MLGQCRIGYCWAEPLRVWALAPFSLPSPPCLALAPLSVLRSLAGGLHRGNDEEEEYQDQNHCQRCGGGGRGKTPRVLVAVRGLRGWHLHPRPPVLLSYYFPTFPHVSEDKYNLTQPCNPYVCGRWGERGRVWLVACEVSRLLDGEHDYEGRSHRERVHSHAEVQALRNRAARHGPRALPWWRDLSLIHIVRLVRTSRRSRQARVGARLTQLTCCNRVYGDV